MLRIAHRCVVCVRAHVCACACVRVHVCAGVCVRVRVVCAMCVQSTAREWLVCIAVGQSHLSKRCGCLCVFVGFWEL
jgi:hypothetical protein